jgi:hypothetical protein
MSISGKDYELNYNISNQEQKGKDAYMMEYRTRVDKYFEYGMETKGQKLGSSSK